MRVVMIGDYPTDPRVVPGGVAAVAHYLTRGIARLPDVELHVIGCMIGLSRERVEERDGATIHFLSDPGRLSYATNWWHTRRRIVRLIDRIGPDIVHAQGLGLPAATVLSLDGPTITTLHGVMWKETDLDHPSLVQRLKARFRARVTYGQMLRLRNVFIISRYAARMLPPGGNYNQYVVNNPVGDEIFALTNVPTRPHVLFVGGTRHRKDPLAAVRVMEAVVREIPEATMHMIGPPSYTPLDREVLAAIADRGLEGKVEVLGLVPEETLWREYERASLLLMTSLEETAPVAIGEAFALGIPVVGTDAGGIPSMVTDGENGFVLPAGQIDSLVAKVTALLRDAELRSRLGAAAAETGRREYALDAIAEQTVAAYREIIA